MNRVHSKGGKYNWTIITWRIRKIKPKCIQDCRNLESLKLPKSLEEITEGTSGCSKLSQLLLEGLE